MSEQITRTKIKQPMARLAEILDQLGAGKVLADPELTEALEALAKVKTEVIRLEEDLAESAADARYYRNRADIAPLQAAEQLAEHLSLEPPSKVDRVLAAIRANSSNDLSLNLGAAR